MATINLANFDLFSAYQLLPEGQSKVSLEDLQTYDDTMGTLLSLLYDSIDPGFKNTDLSNVANVSYQNGTFKTVYTLRLYNIKGQVALKAGANVYPVSDDLKVGKAQFELVSVSKKDQDGKETFDAYLETDIADNTFIIPVALAKDVDGAFLKREYKKAKKIHPEFLGIPAAYPVDMRSLFTKPDGSYIKPEEAQTYNLRVLGFKQGPLGEYGHSYPIFVDPTQMPSVVYTVPTKKKPVSERIDNPGAIYARQNSLNMLSNAFEGESKTLKSKLEQAANEGRLYLKITGFKQTSKGVSIDNSFQILPEAPKAAPTEAPKEEVAVPM